MKNKAVLESADVKLIAAAAEAEALKNHWAVTIAIVDDGGHLLWLQRLDGAAAISSHIAPAKAHTAAMGRRERRRADPEGRPVHRRGRCERREVQRGRADRARGHRGHRSVSFSGALALEKMPG